MKVQCPKCSTTYRLPDDRVPPDSGRLKVRCKHCGYVIDVDVGKTGSQDADDVKWYVAIGNERKGPMNRADVVGQMKGGGIGAETFVWRKGFDEWVRLGDMDEFKAELATSTEDVEETQLMDLDEIRSVTGSQLAVDKGEPAPADDVPEDMAGEPESDEAAEEGEADQEDSGMVWQRRETSVLFSLDDYKTRRKTRESKAILTGKLEVQPIDEGVEVEKAPTVRDTRKQGVINLDESQVKLMAEEMGKRARRRKAVFAGLGGLVAVGVLAAGLYIVVNLETAPVEQAAVPETVSVTPAPEKPEVKPEPAPAVALEKDAAPKAQVPAEAEVEEVEKEKGKPIAKKKPVDRKQRGSKKGKKAKKPRAAVVKKDEPVKPAKPVAAPPPKATQDVNALLASYRSGKKNGAKSGGGLDKGGNAAVASGGNLPSQLTMGQIQSVLRRKTRAVRKCVQGIGLAPGTLVKAKTKIVISGSGRVIKASVSNARGAEGCIKTILKGLVFPRFKGQNMVVPYPFTVSL